MVKRLKKFQSGEGARYLTRKAALNKLQLNLRDFRTLCIMKGIYPREPKHRRRAQKGKTGIHTLYLKKDIQFLLHEPIVWKLRELKVHLRRIKRAKSMREYKDARRYGNTIPILNIDHIIKERYPTFIDALRDMDDCLTLCFLFASLPRAKNVPPYVMAMCRRLTLEFLHVVIATRALQYVFVSIKGIYFQVELRGQTITWIVPHQFGHEPQLTKEVDFQTMATFAEFYITMLGFINFRLYTLANLYYPPQLQGYTTEELEYEMIEDRVALSDRVSALNIPLKTTGVGAEEDNPELDQFPTADNAEGADAAREEYESKKKLKTLFEGMRVFLNREVPREALVFVLRCCGADVSWDNSVFPGDRLFAEDDESITHQIVDRPILHKQYISRYYVQPQWVFDSVNARQLLPVEKYFVGVELPPHLSPFTKQDYRTHRYVPPEEKALNDPSFVHKPAPVIRDEELSEDEEINDLREMMDDNESDAEASNKENETEQDLHKKQLSEEIVVTPGVLERTTNPMRKDMKQHLQMKEKMIRRKYRNLYKSMKQARITRDKEIRLLKYKRRVNERQQHEEKAAGMRALRASAAML